MTLILNSNLVDEGDALEDPDMAKALVMAELARIVEEGGAVIATLESGTIELRLATGEVFHLGEKVGHTYRLTSPAAVRGNLKRAPGRSGPLFF